MPYIKQELRQQLLDDPSKVMYPGELNFLISKRLLAAGGKYDESVGNDIHGYINNFISNNGISYTTYNSILGVWTAVYFEGMRRNWPIAEDTWIDLDEVVGRFARNVVAPYEDKKIQENGDL